MIIFDFTSCQTLVMESGAEVSGDLTPHLEYSPNIFSNSGDKNFNLLVFLGEERKGEESSGNEYRR